MAARTSGSVTVGIAGLPVRLRPSRFGQHSIAAGRASLMGATALALALIALFVVACGPTSRTINGTFTLHQDDGVARDASSCRGKGGYDDIGPGLGVTVTNAEGKVIGLGRLNYQSGLSRSCVYTFTVPDLPNSAFYAVEVGHRGQVPYSRADLEARNWTVEVTLGE